MVDCMIDCLYRGTSRCRPRYIEYHYDEDDEDYDEDETEEELIQRLRARRQRRRRAKLLLEDDADDGIDDDMAFRRVRHRVSFTNEDPGSCY